MISSSNRFRGPKSLNFVYKAGAVSRGPIFAIKAAINPRRSTYRAAVVISRKVHKSAVARNRMRRRLYEVIRDVEPQINGPYDIVITVFNDTVLGASPKELSGQLKKQLKELGVLGQKSSS